MKNRILLAGLCTTVAFASCTNEELINVAQDATAKSDFALISDEMGVPTSRMSYADGDFKWYTNGDNNPNSDAVGVMRVLNKEQGNVVSNVKFVAAKVTDDPTKTLDQWSSNGEGLYAYFTTTQESIFAGDYVVAYPWNPDFVKDGKVPATLKAIQNVYGNNNKYVAENGFMMSTATTFAEGGQKTGKFTLYPVFSRLKFNVTSSISDVKLQSIILREKSGKEIFPTEMEVSAGITVAEDGFLDQKMMSFKDGSKVSELALTMDGTANLSATAASTYYLTVMPGEYSNVEMVFVTNKGTYVKATKNPDVTLSTGRYASIDVNIDKLEANREYYVTTEQDWVNALNNIASVSTGESTGTTIKVFGDVKIASNKFRTSNLTQNIVVEGDENASITVTSGTPVSGAKFGNITFNVPVTYNTAFAAIDGETAKFNKGLNVESTATFAGTNTNSYSYTINGGEFKSTVSVNSANKTNTINLNNVEFKNAVTVSGAPVKDTTPLLTFKDCTFASTLTAQTSSNNFIIDGGVFDDGNDKTANATLNINVGSQSSSVEVVTIKGSVVAERVAVSQSNNVLRIDGELTVNNALTKQANAQVKVMKDAKLTLGKGVNYTATDDKLMIEGTLVNEGTMTVSNGIKLTDVTSNNNHCGQLINNGIVKIANAVWYFDQNIVFTNNNSLIFTGVTASNFESAIETKDVTGVETNGSISFANLKNKDYSNIDFVFGGTSTITLPNGFKAGDVTVNGSVTLSANAAAEKEASVTFANIDVVAGKSLTINKTANTNVVKVTTGNVNVDGSIVNADQITMTGELTIGANGSVSGQINKK